MTLILRSPRVDAFSAWAFLNWASVFPSFSYKIDTSSSNRAVSSFLSLLTVTDSSVNDSLSLRLLFFGENTLADGGGLFRGEVRHAKFEGTAVMSTLIFFHF